MDVKALQRRLREFAAARDWQAYHAPKNLAMALMVEAAELLELFQWQTLAESRAFARQAADKERVADEIADVLLYLLQLADHTGVDVEQAVQAKLRKNAEKHPAKHPEPQPAVPAPKVHLLVDWENVQPTGAELRALAPQGTDVWLFHGPQQKVDDSSHRQAYGEPCVTRVQRSGAGRNALDFQLTYYVGYIAARQPLATFVVVSNDQGYDPMLEHARELGFTARRCEWRKKPAPAAVAARPALPVPATVPAPLAVCAPSVLAEPPAAPAAPVMEAPTKKVPAKKAPVAQMPVQPSAERAGRATRQDVQRLIRMLKSLQPQERPDRRDALLVVLQAHLGELSPHAPRVAHALARLQAQRCLSVSKGGSVTYPPQAAPAAAPKAVTGKGKGKVPAQKTAALPPGATPSPTAAQIALRVLASLRKMPANKPLRRDGLLRFIETHAAQAADPKAMGQQVCALLEARKDVVPAPDGQRIRYPKMEVKMAASA